MLRVLPVALVLAACGSTPSDDRESVPAEPTPIAVPPQIPAEGERGVAGTSGGQSDACAQRAHALGAEVGATATVTGLPANARTTEEIARLPCEPDEPDDECLRRSEGAARAEHGLAADLAFELDGERRQVRAVIRLDGARVERTFESTDQLTTFLELQTDAGKEVSVESMLAEIDPTTRVVSVRRERVLAPGEQRGRAQLIVPGTSADVMQRVTDAAGRHHMTVAGFSRMDGSFQVTVECQ